MAGHLAPVADSDLDYRAAAAYGQASGNEIETDLTIVQADLPAQLAAPGTPATISGTLHCPLLSPRPLQVTSGEFVLMTPDPTHVATDNMRYRFTARSAEGDDYGFEGHKVIHNGPARRAWQDTTTLFVTITSDPRSGLPPEVYRGVLRVSVGSLRRLVASITVSHAPSPSEGARLERQFLLHFLGALWPFYGGVLDEGVRFPTGRTVPAIPPSPGGHGADLVRWCDPDGLWHDRPVPSASSRLIRYCGGEKGPVVLAAGFAMSATSFTVGNSGPSLVEYLIDRGFDVWLFDYRAGIDLPSAWSQCTIDDIAGIDWPRAVDEVIARTGRPDVQALGHCVGSVSLLMTLLAGTRGIRSAICAQFTAFPVTSALNRAKADLRIGALLADLGVARMGPDVAGHPLDVALDLALRPVPMPRGERCGLAVCRWINAIFGLTHVHEQLDDATHREITRLFGVGNLTALRHLVLMLQRGRLVDADGLDRYLSNVGTLDVPIHFLAGTRNYIFHPEGTQRTLSWLQESLGKDLAARLFSATYLEGYGHLDAIIGRDAATDVFPVIVQHLDAHPSR